MRYAIIENGIVANTAEAEVPLAENWVLAVDGVEIGDLFDGEVFSKPELIATVPQSVTPRQAKLALLGVGLLDSVDEALSAIPDPTTKRAAQIEWEYATEFRRNAPLIATMGAALNLTDEQIDALFIAASAI